MLFPAPFLQNVALCFNLLFAYRGLKFRLDNRDSIVPCQGANFATSANGSGPNILASTKPEWNAGYSGGFRDILLIYVSLPGELFASLFSVR